MEIIEELKKLIAQNWIVNPRKQELFAALSLFDDKNLSFVDGWIYTVNQSVGTKLAKAVVV